MSKVVLAAAILVLMLCSFSIAAGVLLPICTWLIYKSAAETYAAMLEPAGYTLILLIIFSSFTALVLALASSSLTDRLAFTLIAVGMITLLLLPFGVGFMGFNSEKLGKLLGITVTPELLKSAAYEVKDFVFFKVYMIDEEGMRKLQQIAKEVGDPLCSEMCSITNKTCIEKCKAAITYCRSLLSPEAEEDDLRKCVELYMTECDADPGCILAKLTN